MCLLHKGSIGVRDFGVSGYFSEMLQTKSERMGEGTRYLLHGVPIERIRMQGLGYAALFMFLC